MCHDDDSIPAVRSDGPPAKRRTLTARDGGVFAVSAAIPAGEPAGGVVILPDNRGLHPFYERLASGLAAEGYAAIAMDYFGRTAGVEPRDDAFEFMPHLFRTSRETIDADIAACSEFLRTGEGGGCRRIFAVGFCFGGRQAFFASRRGMGMAAVVGFYGGPGVFPNGAVGPTQLAHELSAPILAIFGEADEGIPVVDRDAFERALREASVPHEVVTYEGAPHSFFDLRQQEFRAASEDAWSRTLDWLKRYR